MALNGVGATRLLRASARLLRRRPSFPALHRWLVLLAVKSKLPAASDVNMFLSQSSYRIHVLVLVGCVRFFCFGLVVYFSASKFLSQAGYRVHAGSGICTSSWRFHLAKPCRQVLDRHVAYVCLHCIIRLLQPCTFAFSLYR